MEVALSAANESEMQQQGVESCLRKEFKHFRDNGIYKILCQICKTLGQYGDLELLVDNFLNVYSTSETNCKQSVIALNQILLGAKYRKSQESVLTSIKTILEELLTPENWYLVTSIDSEYIKTHHHVARVQKMFSLDEKTSLLPVTSASSYKEQSLRLLKSNTLLSCLHLESVLTFSKVLGGDFRSYHMLALHPVLEKTTDPDSSIAGCAVRALHGIALNCGYNTSSELVAENADYLISNIPIQIHKLEVFPRCPAVLQAMLDHSNSDVLVLVSDTVDEILSALDLHHLEPRKLLIFIPVLLSVINAIRRWASCRNQKESVKSNLGQSNKSETKFMGEFSKQKGNIQEISQENVISDGEVSKKSADGDRNKCFINNLRSSLIDIHKSRKIASLEEDPEIDTNWKPGQEEDEQYQHPAEEEEKKDLPLDVKVTSKVLNRCIHLMAHSNARIRIRVMDIVESGMTALAGHDNELLPMAHKLWSPLVARFNDKELQVVMKAFNTLCVIAEHSKDFLRKRFCKETLPKVLYVLESHAKSTLRTTSRTSNLSGAAVVIPKLVPESCDSVAFSHSVIFKLQKKVLSGLGPLLKDLDLRRLDHLSVCQACSPYLSSRQPRQLQESALILFRYLIQIDSDLTWVQLTGVWCPRAILEPVESQKLHVLGKNLQPCYLAGSSDPKNEFSNNISKLLNEC